MNLNESQQLMDFFLTIDRLETLPRTGYFFAGIKQPESIAAHAFGVAFIAMVIADKTKMAVNMERVLRLAVLHDATESVLTDIPYSIFKYLGQDNKRLAEEKAAADLLAAIDPTYVEVWNEFEACQTLEARLVNAADKLQMLIKILNYERSGIGCFTEFWRNFERHEFCGLEVFQELHKLARQRHDSKT